MYTNNNNNNNNEEEEEEEEKQKSIKQEWLTASSRRERNYQSQFLEMCVHKVFLFQTVLNTGSSNGRGQ